jgi:hypothetical protein
VCGERPTAAAAAVAARFKYFKYFKYMVACWFKYFLALAAQRTPAAPLLLARHSAGLVPEAEIRAAFLERKRAGVSFED